MQKSSDRYFVDRQTLHRKVKSIFKADFSEAFIAIYVMAFFHDGDRAPKQLDSLLQMQPLLIDAMASVRRQITENFALITEVLTEFRALSANVWAIANDADIPGFLNRLQQEQDRIAVALLRARATTESKLFDLHDLTVELAMRCPSGKRPEKAAIASG